MAKPKEESEDKTEGNKSKSKWKDKKKDRREYKGETNDARSQVRSTISIKSCFTISYEALYRPDRLALCTPISLKNAYAPSSEFETK